MKNTQPAHITELFREEALHALAEHPEQGSTRLHDRLNGLDLHVRLNHPQRPEQTAVGTLKTPALALPEEDARIANDLRLAIRVHQRHLPILVTGETGSGKEVFARAVHAGSDRRDCPFIALNCAALPESLIESELFGYAPGAFTGARAKGMRGLLLQADGGTLFLDEIGDMPLTLQTRLLRVLAEGEVLPLGAAQAEKVDLRLICATHRDLGERVSQGYFREDLYYRLNGVTFHLPPLRERTDQAALIQRILEEEASACRLNITLAPETLECLLACSWPGNVRQLRNVLRYACAVCSSNCIYPADLPKDISHTSNAYRTSPSDCPERRRLLEALICCHWKPRLAAAALGISRATLYRRLRQYAIEMPGHG